MRKRVLFAAAFLSASILAGCSASSPAQTGSEAAVSSVVSQTVSSLDDSVYTNAEKTFQFTVPQGWKEESSKTTKDRVLFVSPGGDRALELKRQQPDANLLAYSKSDFVVSTVTGCSALRCWT